MQRPKSAMASTNRQKQQRKKSFFVVKNNKQLKNGETLTLGGPIREMIKSHGRFGPYEVNDVLITLSLFRRIANGNDQIHLDVILNLAETSPDPQLCSLLHVVAANPNHRSSNCTLESFMSSTLPHAKIDEIRRAVKTCRVYEMLLHIRSDFQKDCTSRTYFSTLSSQIHTEVQACFVLLQQQVKVETITLTEIRHLINHSKLLVSRTLLDDENMEQIATVLGIDIDQELFVPDFLDLLNALIISESRKFARRSSRTSRINSNGSFSTASHTDIPPASPAQRRGSKVAIAFAKFGQPGVTPSNRPGTAPTSNRRRSSVCFFKNPDLPNTTPGGGRPGVALNTSRKRTSFAVSAPSTTIDDTISIVGQPNVVVPEMSTVVANDHVRDALLAFSL